MTIPDRPESRNDLQPLYFGCAVMLVPVLFGLVCRMTHGRVFPRADTPGFDFAGFYIAMLALIGFLGELDRWAGLPPRGGISGERLDGRLGLGLAALWALYLLGMVAAAARDPSLEVPSEAYRVGLETAAVVLAVTASRLACEERAARGGRA